jgi:LacI family transcriptional regulator
MNYNMQQIAFVIRIYFICSLFVLILLDYLLRNENLVFITYMSNEAGEDTARKIMKMKHCPDGIFASNDTSGVAAIIEFVKAGVNIPDEIAGAGFNNDPISKIIQPDLTTVDYPPQEIGEIEESRF